MEISNRKTDTNIRAWSNSDSDGNVTSRTEGGVRAWSNGTDSGSGGGGGANAFPNVIVSLDSSLKNPIFNVTYAEIEAMHQAVTPVLFTLYDRSTEPHTFIDGAVLFPHKETSGVYNVYSFTLQYASAKGEMIMLMDFSIRDDEITSCVIYRQ